MLSRLLARPCAIFGFVALSTAWLCASLPLFSQEAYYWTYAQHLDLSYFDHPPMVAWLIWLGTKLLGDGESGVRLGTWLCGLGTTALGAALLRAFGVGRTGQGLWMLLSIATPILAAAHFLANPDPALVCAWALAMLATWKARSGSLGWWAIAGVAGGLAMLSKYTGAFLAVSGAVLLATDPLLRAQLRRTGPYLAVLVATLLFLPVVYWNARHDFESFRFQTGERFAKAEFSGHWLLEFVLGQTAVFHPVVVVAIGCSIAWLARRWRHDARARWLLAFGLPLPLWFLASSLWIQVKANWLAPAAVPLLLGTVMWCMESCRRTTLPRSVRVAAYSVLLLPAAFLLAPAIRLLPPGRGSSWTGWEQIAAHAERWEDRFDPADGEEGNFFYFAADYRDAAQLGRSLLLRRRHGDPHGHPLAGSIDFEPTMAQNVLGKRALQYDHWNSPRDRVGQDAIFVLPRPEQRGEMVRAAARCFASIEKLDRLELCTLGVHIVDADFYLCRGYKGPVAAD
jgi:dolichol-phosphate mannosyltransferase